MRNSLVVEEENKEKERIKEEQEETEQVEKEQAERKSVVHIEKLFSSEMYLKDGKYAVPVLSGLNLSIFSGETWGVNGDSPFEILLLLKILSNIQHYHSGRCVLVGKGMMAHKRVILPHVFYISSPDMVYGNMNVLEYLMFVTAKSQEDTVARQKRIFEYLIGIGLGNISLTPVSTLRKEQKAVIILLAAAFSDSRLVVFNFPRYEFGETLSRAIFKNRRLYPFRKQNSGHRDAGRDLIDRACTHTAYLMDGQVAYAGSVEEFARTYDKTILTVCDENVGQIAERLRLALPEYRYEVNEDALTISHRDTEKEHAALLYAKILEEGFFPREIQLHTKRTKNAMQGLKEQSYDL